MKKSEYKKIEAYMKACCGESVHDEEHTYRVLYNAIEIAQCESHVNMDILITSCLLHDIARVDEMNDKSIDHAVYGSEKAYKWLIENGYDEGFSGQVTDAIKTHRYRGDNIPKTIEAKILFDADKLDVAGFIGIARTLMYNGLFSRPLYTKDNEKILDGSDGDNSFFREYIFKLQNVYDRLFTEKAKQMSIKMKQDAQCFYETLYNDLNNAYMNGQKTINSILE